MMEYWNWIALGTLAALAIYQYFRVYQVRRESKKREELFQIVTENAADMIALVDVKGHRLYNSPAYKRILGYSAAELGETSTFEQIHPEDRFKVLEAAREARSTGVGKKLEYRIRHKDGRWMVLESIAGTIRDEKGDVTKLVIVNRDITDRKHAEEQAEHNSLHDALTGLPNRTLFLDRLEQIPADLENYALKPLYSFAGLGVVIAPTKADIAAIPAEKRPDYILQERMHFEPVIETPFGGTKAEVRVMYIWLEELTPVLTIIRMGRGLMMGVDHNKNMEWVGASAGLWVE